MEEGAPAANRPASKPATTSAAQASIAEPQPESNRGTEDKPARTERQAAKKAKVAIHSTADSEGEHSGRPLSATSHTLAQ